MTVMESTQRAFTLIELLVTLSVVAIIAAMAAPSFFEMIQNTRLVTQANNLVSTIQYARSEAVKQGVQVSIVRKSNTDSVWEDGWTVFTDWDGDGVFDDDGADPLCDVEEDCVIRTQTAVKNITLRTGNHIKEWLAYLPSGYAISSTGLANDTFRVCAKNVDKTKAKKVVINTLGRPEVEDGADQCP